MSEKRFSIIIDQRPADCVARDTDHPVTWDKNCPLGKLFRNSGATEGAATLSPSGPYSREQLADAGLRLNIEDGSRRGTVSCPKCSLKIDVRRGDLNK